MACASCKASKVRCVREGVATGSGSLLRPKKKARVEEPGVSKAIEVNWAEIAWAMVDAVEAHGREVREGLSEVAGAVRELSAVAQGWSVGIRRRGSEARSEVVERSGNAEGSGSGRMVLDVSDDEEGGMTEGTAEAGTTEESRGDEESEG